MTYIKRGHVIFLIISFSSSECESCDAGKGGVSGGGGGSGGGEGGGGAGVGGKGVTNMIRPKVEMSRSGRFCGGGGDGG